MAAGAAGSLKTGPNEIDDLLICIAGFWAVSEQAAPAYGLPMACGVRHRHRPDGNSSAIWFKESGGEPSIVRAAVPIRNGEALVGVIAVEQAGGSCFAIATWRSQSCCVSLRWRRSPL